MGRSNEWKSWPVIFCKSGIGKKQVVLVLVASKHRRHLDLVLSSDRGERRMPNVAWHLFQRMFSSDYKICPVVLTASSALDAALMERTGQSPEGPPSFFMEPISSLSSANKKASKTSPVWLFHPRPPADSVLQESSCKVETFSHQLLWEAETASLWLQYLQPSLAI